MTSSTELNEIPSYCDQLKVEYEELVDGCKNSETELESLKESTKEWSEHNTQTYGLSYRLNLELHKEAEIGKRLESLLEKAINKLPDSKQEEYLNQVKVASQVSSDDLVERIKKIKEGNIKRVHHQD